jgi:hypothetical protein
MPARPVLAPKPLSRPDWVHEIKHDGYRVTVRRPKRVTCGTQHTPVTRDGEALGTPSAAGISRCAMGCRLLSSNGDEDDHAIFGADRSGDVTLAGEVFRQFDAAGPDLDRLSSRQHELCVAAERDHILAA